jgi:PAS domain-containing protein
MLFAVAHVDSYHLVDLNEPFAAAFGYEREELLDRPVRLLVHGTKPGLRRSDRRRRAVTTGEIITGTDLFRCRDGSSISLGYQAILVGRHILVHCTLLGNGISATQGPRDLFPSEASELQLAHASLRWTGEMVRAQRGDLEDRVLWLRGRGVKLRSIAIALDVSPSTVHDWEEHARLRLQE